MELYNLVYYPEKGTFKILTYIQDSKPSDLTIIFCRKYKYCDKFKVMILLQFYHTFQGPGPYPSTKAIFNAYHIYSTHKRVNKILRDLRN